MMRWVHWIQWGYTLKCIGIGLAAAAAVVLPWVMLYNWFLGLI